MAPPHRHPALTRPRLDRRELRRLAPYAGYRAAAALAVALPEPAAYAVGRVAGAVMAAVSGRRRRVVQRHLRRVHGPGLRGAALHREVLRSFDSYARYWVESFRLGAAAPRDLDAAMDCEGVEHLDGALAAGAGAILVAPHLGAWDFGGAWLASRGYRVTAVAEALEPPELFEFFSRMRRRLGLTIVPLGPEAGPALVRALRANEVAGLVSDRDIGGAGVEVEFFGERTRVPAGAATLSLRTGAPIIPCAMYYDGPRHRGLIRPPIAPERTGSFRTDVTRLSQAVTDELEALIRRAPEQWHLFQPNWPSDHEALG